MRNMMPLAFMLLTSVCVSAQPVGKRPYEMELAGRTKDEHPPFEDFQSDAPWQVEGNGTVAETERTREQQLFGDYVLKLTYRAVGDSPTVVIRPPVKKEVPADFDAIGLWVYGNNWLWENDTSTPRVGLHVLFKTPDGKETAVYLCTCNWKEWFFCHKRLTPEQQELLHQPGTVFSGIKITNAGNKYNRALFFNSLTLFKEEFKPLSFAPRARRGIALFPGQDPGVNTLQDKVLPFPNREDTILPDSAADGSKNTVALNGQTAVFSYDGSDGKLSITYAPKTGRWTDFTAKWNNEPPFKPLQDGGVLFPGKGDGELPDKAELKGIQQVGNKITAQWHVTKGDAEADVAYTVLAARQDAGHRHDRERRQDWRRDIWLRDRPFGHVERVHPVLCVCVGFGPACRHGEDGPIADIRVWPYGLVSLQRKHGKRRDLRQKRRGVGERLRPLHSEDERRTQRRV